MPTKHLSLDLPQSLHTRFKTACSATRRKMVHELQAFMTARTEELEKEGLFPQMNIPYRLGCGMELDGPSTTQNQRYLDVLL